MEKYEQISMVGEGSYGLVLKCRHRETDQLVAIKKFLETEEDATVRRMALREIRMLKKLKHENLVTMIEVFRYRKRFYLVFEYLEGTILDELEKMPGGLGDDRCRERIFQVTRAVNYCHSNNIIHRDVKPENVLVSSLGVVKLCDFGFARIVTIGNEPCTEYVATRWYRAPELLVGEEHYGPPVDIWAIGCLFAEMMTGDPLFPGESDIDQLYLIVKMIGKPCSSHQQLMLKNSQLRGMMKATSDSNGLYKCFSNWSLLALDFLVSCMKMDPHYRLASDELLRHNYFTHDKFPHRFLPALREKIHHELSANPLLRRYKTDILLSTDRKDEYRSARRSLQTEPSRWKFNLAEGSIKRKFSCDTMNENGANAAERHAASLSRGSQKLSLTQKPSKATANHSKDDNNRPRCLPKTGQSADRNNNKPIEVPKLERSLQNLTRLAQKPDNVRCRPSSVQKNKSSPSTNARLASPQQFQSLQHQPLSINTMLKRSPNPLLQSLSIKGAFNQGPAISVSKPIQPSFLKRLDRNNDAVHVEPLHNNHLNNNNAPTWLNGNAKRKDKAKGDDFTLPNLPGAISPMKNRKKNVMENGNNEITPRMQSSTSQKSTSSKVLQSLPFM